MHKQTTQEAKFCYRCVTSGVLVSHSHLCMGKGKRKRNKELGTLSRVLQGQPFSPCVVLCPSLSLPQVNSTSFPSPNLSHAPLRCCCTPPGSVEPAPLESQWQCQQAQPQLPALPWTTVRIPVWSRLAFPWAKSTGGTKQEASCSVCSRKICISAGTDEI